MSMVGELLRGLSVTLGYVFRKPMTQMYPAEKPKLPPRFRGLHQLQRVVHAGGFRDMTVGKDTLHQGTEPGTDLGKVFEQEYVSHGLALIGKRRRMLKAFRAF